MINFLNIHILFLLIPIILFVIFLYFYWVWKNNFWPINDLNKVFINNSKYYKIYLFLIFSVFVLFIFYFSKPFFKSSENSIKWNIQIVLDMSYSMNSDDILPTRFEASKGIISDFITNLKNYNLWLVVFSWKPYVWIPLSNNYSVIKNILEKIDIDSIDTSKVYLQWSAIWDSLLLASKSLQNENQNNIIILITDWDNNSWTDPLDAIKYVNNKSKDIKIYTIWVWKDEKSLVYDDWKSIEIDWLNSELLKNISEKTWWKYFSANDFQSINDAFSEIYSLENSNKTLIYWKKDLSENIIILLFFLYIITFILKYYKKL